MRFTLLNQATYTMLFVTLYVASTVFANGLHLKNHGGEHDDHKDADAKHDDHKDADAKHDDHKDADSKHDDHKDADHDDHKAKDEFDMLPIINDIANARRTILALSITSNHLTLLVSGPSGNADLEGALIFSNVAGSSISDPKVKLHQPEKLLVKWPALKGHSGAMFFTSDTNGQYLVIVDQKETHTLDIKTGSLSKILWVDMLSQNNLFDQKNPISSSEGMAFYNYGYNKIPGYLSKLKFGNSSLPQSTSLLPAGSVYICTSGVGKIVVSSTCSSPVTWTIKTGCIGEDNVLLVDEKNGVIFFKKEALSSGSPVNFTTVPAKHFWQRSVPHTHPPSHLATTTGRKPSMVFIISIGVVSLLVSISIPVIYFTFCFKKKKKDSSSPPPPAPSGSQYDRKPSGKQRKRSSTQKQRNSRGASRGKRSPASSRTSSGGLKSKFGGANPKRAPTFPKLHAQIKAEREQAEKRRQEYLKHIGSKQTRSGSKNRAASKGSGSY